MFFELYPHTTSKIALHAAHQQSSFTIYFSIAISYVMPLLPFVFPVEFCIPYRIWFRPPVALSCPMTRGDGPSRAVVVCGHPRRFQTQIIPTYYFRTYPQIKLVFAQQSRVSRGRCTLRLVAVCGANHLCRRPLLHGSVPRVPLCPLVCRGCLSRLI